MDAVLPHVRPSGDRAEPPDPDLRRSATYRLTREPLGFGQRAV